MNDATTTNPIQGLWQALVQQAQACQKNNTYPCDPDPVIRSDMLTARLLAQDGEVLARVPQPTVTHFMLAGETVNWNCDPNTPLWEHDATVDIALYSIDEDGRHGHIQAIRAQLQALTALPDAELWQAVRVGVDTVDSRIAGE